MNINSAKQMYEKIFLSTCMYSVTGGLHFIIVYMIVKIKIDAKFVLTNDFAFGCVITFIMCMLTLITTYILNEKLWQFKGSIIWKIIKFMSLYMYGFVNIALVSIVCFFLYLTKIMNNF